MQVAYVSNVTRPRDAIQHRASWHKQNVETAYFGQIISIFTTQTGLVSDM